MPDPIQNPKSKIQNCVVVGCGVIGLTSAIRLQEAGVETTILTRERAKDTTSAVAAAVWYPYKAYPEDRVLPWGRRTLEILYDLARDPDTGCSITTLIELFDHPEPDPWWIDAVEVFRRSSVKELKPGFIDGFTIEVPLIETPVHLRYLEHRFERGGGKIEVVPGGLDGLAPLYAEGRLIVNCTGLGAVGLVGDGAMTPIRGQIVRVSNPGLRHCLVEENNPDAMTYIIPRTHDCILGGTALEDDWSLEPDAAVTERILRSACDLEPRLREARILEVLVGLRPGRPEVRLERETVAPGCAVIHNYGHGGSGYTLGWGCADEVVALAQSWQG